MPKKNLKVIGVGGYARAGKDLFVKIASQILEKNGYTSKKLAFADALKNDLDPFLQEKYGISAWTDDTEHKKIVRPLMVAHGCGKRNQTEGKYWVEKIDQKLRLHSDLLDTYPDAYTNHVFFISDCRFPNEVTWLHNNWNGWFVHLKKYSVQSGMQYDSFTGEQTGVREWKQYDDAPNDEEAKNDPIIQKSADYKLELENAIDRAKREGIKITMDDLPTYSYLNREITLCLAKCPFLTIQTP